MKTIYYISVVVYVYSVPFCQSLSNTKTKSMLYLRHFATFVIKKAMKAHFVPLIYSYVCTCIV